MAAEQFLVNNNMGGPIELRLIYGLFEAAMLFACVALSHPAATQPGKHRFMYDI